MSNSFQQCPTDFSRRGEKFCRGGACYERDIRLLDDLERQALSLNLQSKLVMSLMFEKHIVVLE